MIIYANTQSIKLNVKSISYTCEQSDGYKIRIMEIGNFCNY